MEFKLLAKEKPAATLARARKWLAALRHPKGTFLALEELFDGSAKFIGYRTFLAREPVIVDDRDVTKATLALRDGEPEITIELGKAGAALFADVTREWQGKRIAILVDGLVVTAPMVKSEIRGGRVLLQAPGDTPAARRASADRLVRALNTKR